MKNMIIGILVSVMAVLSVKADNTNELKIACQQSDKTLWVERNNLCIPKHPCGDESKKIQKYCDWNTFSSVTSSLYDEWKDLVRIYVKKHNINCEPEEVINDHFVLCKGNDVKEFNFSGIYNIWKDDLKKALSIGGKYSDGAVLVKEICEKSLGGIYNEEERMCMKISKSDCENTKEIIKSGNFGSRIFVYWIDFGDKPGCNIAYTVYNEDEHVFD